MKKETGFSLIELLIVVAIIGIIAAIAIPNLLQSRKTANEASAIGVLRTCASAQVTYQGNNQTYGLITDLNAAKLIDDSILASRYTSQGSFASVPPKSGYVFGDISTVSATEFNIFADPKTAGQSGDRHFGVAEDGVIHVDPANWVYRPAPGAPLSGQALGTAASAS